jgi:hypothetical protein
MRARNYLAWYAAACALLSVLVVLIAVLADPYRVFGTPTFAGVNEIKPRIYQNADVAKSSQLARKTARTLVLGNSRAEIGFDPASASWPQDAQPVFNAAQAGSGIDIAVARLQCSIAMHSTNLAVVGLDLQDFLVQPRRAVHEAAAEKPDRDDRSICDATSATGWKSRLSSTLTISALSDSLTTLLNQDRDSGVTMEPNGFNPLRDYRLHVQRVGHNGLFAQWSVANHKTYSRISKPDFSHPDSYEPIRELRQLLAVSTAHQVDLVLFIHPYHADFLSMLDKLGLWPTFEGWKRFLVELTAAESRRRSVPLRIIDFSGYHEYATESAPPQGDTRSTMRWYWEPGHYKSELGDRMLSRIFGHSDFGVELSPSNVEEHIAALRAQRELHRRSVTPEVVADRL